MLKTLGIVKNAQDNIYAKCGLKFEKTKKICNAEMINILGKEIEDYRSKSFQNSEFFFDYRKKTIKDKRKMGHVTILKK